MDERIEINLVWVLNNEAPHPWVVDAWDEFSIEENFEGYQEALEKAKKDHDEVRVQRVSVPIRTVDSLFLPTEVLKIEPES